MALNVTTGFKQQVRYETQFGSSKRKTGQHKPEFQNFGMKYQVQGGFGEG